MVSSKKVKSLAVVLVAALGAMSGTVNVQAGVVKTIVKMGVGAGVTGYCLKASAENPKDQGKLGQAGGLLAKSLGIRVVKNDDSESEQTEPEGEIPLNQEELGRMYAECGVKVIGRGTKEVFENRKNPNDEIKFNDIVEMRQCSDNKYKYIVLLEKGELVLMWSDAFVSGNDVTEKLSQSAHGVTGFEESVE